MTSVLACIPWAAADCSRAGARADKVKIGFHQHALARAPRSASTSAMLSCSRLKLNGGRLGGLPAEVDRGPTTSFKPDVGRQRRRRTSSSTRWTSSRIRVLQHHARVRSGGVQNKVIYVSPNAAPSPLAGKQCNPYFCAVMANDAYHEPRDSMRRPRLPGRIHARAQLFSGADSLEGFKRFYKGRVAGEVYTQSGSSTIRRARAGARGEARGVHLPSRRHGRELHQAVLAAGLSKDIQLITPVLLRPDIIRAVGDPMLDFRRGALALDLDNAATRNSSPSSRRSTSACTVYARRLRHALLIDSAVREVKGRTRTRKACAWRSSRRSSSRCAPFRFNRNQYPIQTISSRSG